MPNSLLSETLEAMVPIVVMLGCLGAIYAFAGFEVAVVMALGLIAAEVIGPR